MSDDEIKSLALRYQQAWAANDHATIDEICAGTIVVHYSLASGPARGRAALKAMLDGIHQTFPDLSIETHQIIAEADTVALRWTMRGTHHDTHASWPGQNMLRVKDGKIVEDFGVDDGLGMLRQLGVHSIPGTRN